MLRGRGGSRRLAARGGPARPMFSRRARCRSRRRSTASGARQLAERLERKRSSVVLLEDAPVLHRQQNLCPQKDSHRNKPFNRQGRQGLAKIAETSESQNKNSGRSHCFV